MEISMLELGLVVWAGWATALWMDARSDARATKMLLKTMIENKELRDGIVAKFEEFKKMEGTL